jgi:hypothetical protein
MAETATARVVPAGTAKELTALATAIAAETDIDTATVSPSAGIVDVKRNHIVVVTDALADIAACDTAIANANTAEGAQLMPGQTTTYVTS